ncbi:hypothetical protein Tco_1115849, partial [Tanacetum coccineum]
AEEAVGGRRNWLDMMIVYLQKFTDEHRDFALSVNRLLRDMNESCLDRRAFVRELRSMSGEIVPARAAVFLEEMMDKEGNREWQLRELGKEAREMASEIEAFLLKLMDPSHKRVFGIDVGQRVIWKKCIRRDENSEAMEWSPRCEKLEKAVGGHRWMDMMIVYLQEFEDEQRDFALRVNRLIGDTHEACLNRMYFEGMKSHLCDLEKEANKMAHETNAFLFKLMDEEPSHRHVFRLDDGQRGQPSDRR